jgi:hypothetical protein
MMAGGGSSSPVFLVGVHLEFSLPLRPPPSISGLKLSSHPPWRPATVNTSTDHPPPLLHSPSCGLQVLRYIILILMDASVHLHMLRTHLRGGDTRISLRTMFENEQPIILENNEIARKFLTSFYLIHSKLNQEK